MSSAKIKAPAPGTLLAGKYLVEGLLGVGGVGAVVSAHHRQLDQKVAIKVLLPAVSQHPEVLERFAREARAAAKIHGEHVARVIDVGELDDGSPFMVMEHLEGRDLSAELRAKGPLSVSLVVQYMIEACDAIAQAHAAKIVHRDLKPSNLFLARTPDGRDVVKVLDFGISKVVDPDAPALTKTSNLVGTPYYMSPEQLTAAKTVDSRADIWALGVIMYELLVGQPPFTGDSMPAVVAAILTNEPAPLDKLRPQLPQGLTQVVSKCIRTKMEDRYSSVAAFTAALAPFGNARDREMSERIARTLGFGSLNPDPLQETLLPDTEAAPKISGSNSSSSSSSSSGSAPPGPSSPPLAAIVAGKTLVLDSSAKGSSVPSHPSTDTTNTGDISPTLTTPAVLATSIAVSSAPSTTPSAGARRSTTSRNALIAVAVALFLGVGTYAFVRARDDGGGGRGDSDDMSFAAPPPLSASGLPTHQSSAPPTFLAINPGPSPTSSTTTPMQTPDAGVAITPPPPIAKPPTVHPPHINLPATSPPPPPSASTPPPATSPSKKPMEMLIK